ncbi:hypothetical protein NST66_03780 [Priestia sp. FSL W8-0524]|uniref:hypothetical protein n=1 Tax=Priestia TaxID=2800373 RepID=UPI000532CF60|nr:hypothetical protein [Priestia aryabhattai]
MKKRTKTIIAVIAGAAILIGGIWMINESRYPNVPAFDDHFTREFLNKDKKVDDGFYEFKSKTGQYTMWFPEEYQLLHENEQQYVKEGKLYERYRAVSNSNELEYMTVEFSNKIKKNESIYVERLFQEQFNINKPHKVETKNVSIYYDKAYSYFKGTHRQVIRGKEGYTPNTYVAYIADKHSNSVIKFYFDNVKEKLTEKQGEEQDKRIMKILKSVKFNEVKNNAE